MNTFEIMERLMVGRNSRAASLPERKENGIVTEIVDGLIVSKPAKREPEVIDLQEYAKSKAASVPGINKMREIYSFMKSNGRL